MILELLIYKILQLLVMMAIGFVIAKCGIINPKNSEVLSKISLYLLMPSAIINAFNFDKTKELMTGLGLAFLAAIVIHIIFLWLDRVYIKLFGGNPVERASVMYSNAGNLIIPIVTFVLGNEWVVYSTAYISVQIVFLWTHGIRIFSSDTKLNVKKVLYNINIIAIMLGIIILLSGIRLPDFVGEITSSFGDMLGPVGMLIAGILASKIDFKKMLKNKRVYLVAIIRLIVYPIISLLVVKLLGNIPIENIDKILFISLLACITPSASTVMQFAQIKHSDTELAAQINIFTTVCCIITIPLMASLY